MTNERAQTELPSLKGCPFCGSSDVKLERYWSRWVVCTKCEARGRWELVSDEKAVANWNTRTPSPETPVSATPSADVSSLEKVARAMHSEMLAMENEDGGEGCEFDETTPEQRAMLDRLARAALAAYNTEAAIVLKRLETENERLTALLNTPAVEDWAKGAVLEAGHQRERWGADHDAGKSPFDWFWLVGYLAQKAAASAVAGDVEKAKHHTISTGAALANWHLALSGTDNRMVPGAPLPIVEQGEATVSALEPGCGEPWICAPCDAVNNDIRQRCRFCKKPRSEVARSKRELE